MSGESSFLITVRRSLGTNNIVTLGNIDRFVKLEYVLVENDIGALSLALPDTFPQEWFETDTILEVYRTIDGVTTLEGETFWFVRETRFTLSERGEWLFVVIAFDAKHLLDRRIVLNYSGSSQASKTGTSDNIMRAVVREQLGASASADSVGIRRIIDVEPDATLFPSISKAFAWRNVLSVVKDIADSLLLSGYCAFHITRSESAYNGLIFRVKRGAWGVDRGSDSAAPMLFTPENGALFNVSIAFDARDEITVVRVNGPGEGANRIGGLAAHTTALARAYWNRIEAHVDARQTVQFSELLTEALAYLMSHRSGYKFTANIQQTAQLKYGVHYFWGDIVVAAARGLAFNTHLRKVSVVADANGEQINIEVSAFGGTVNVDDL